MSIGYLPVVGGDRVERPLIDLDRAARICLRDEQAKINPDNGLVAVLCDTVRLIREHTALARQGLDDLASGATDALA